MSEKRLLTTSEVADKLSITRWRVSQLIQSGRLKAEKYGQIYLIDENDLDLVKERKPGRPKKAVETVEVTQKNKRTAAVSIKKT